MVKTRFSKGIVIWVADGVPYRNLSLLALERGWGGLHVWRSRHGHPGEFVYRGINIKRYEI